MKEQKVIGFGYSSGYEVATCLNRFIAEGWKVKKQRLVGYDDSRGRFYGIVVLERKIKKGGMQ